MIPQAFEYDAPTTLEDAIALLQQYGDDAKILSGGHSLIPMMKTQICHAGKADRHQWYSRFGVYRGKGWMAPHRLADQRIDVGRF